MICVLPPNVYVWGYSAQEALSLSPECHQVHILPKADIKLFEQKVQASERGYFTFPSKRRKGADEEQKRKRVDDLLKYLPITVTGARPGELVVGSKKSVKGFSFQVKNIIGASEEQLDLVLDNHVRPQFMTNLQQKIPYFRGKSDQEIVAHLRQHETTLTGSAPVGSGDPDQRFTVLSFGENAEFETRLQNKEEILNVEQPYSFLDASIPRTTAQKDSKKPHLCFSRKYYTVDVTTNYYAAAPSRFVLDLDTGELAANRRAPPSPGEFISRQRLLSSRDPVYAKINEDLCIRTVYTQRSGTEEGVLLRGCRSAAALSGLKASPSVLKSLLQKLIRFSPKEVEIKRGVVVAAEDLLVWTVTKLVFHKGSFVPNIQKFVSGAVSFFKRAGVIYFEDAFHPKVNPLFFFGAALLCREDSQWFPSAGFIRARTDDMKTLLSSALAYEYTKPNQIAPQQLNPQNRLASCSYMLDELKSFLGDLQMVRYVANNPGQRYVMRTQRPAKAPIYHCVDQHASPSVVYLFNYRDCLDLKTKGSKPFSKLIRKLFKEVTNLNPRKGELKTNTPFFKSVRVCQQRFWEIFCKPSYGRLQEPGSSFRFDYELDPMWIAAMIGHLEVKVNSQKFYVTISSVVPLKWQVVRVPSRDKTKGVISEAQISAAEQKALSLLKAGVAFQATKFRLPGVDHKHYQATLADDDSFVLVPKVAKKRLPTLSWNTQRHLSLKLPLYTEVPSSPFVEGTGVSVRDVPEAVKKVLSPFQQAVNFRLLQLLDHFDPVIHLPAVGRDGGGTEEAVCFEDMAVFEILCEFCRLFPGAFRLKDTTTFTTPSVILRSYLKACVQQVVAEAKTQGFRMDNERVSHELQRNNMVLKPQQKQVLDLLNSQLATGKRGFGLFITAGFGKTFTFLSFFHANRESMPSRLVWSVNKEAISSIYGEMCLFMKPEDIYIIWTNKVDKVGKKLKYPPFTRFIHLQNEKLSLVLTTEDGTILKKSPLGDFPQNAFFLIKHDSLRLASSLAIDNSFFVMDEFHKALNSETKRTQAALRFASAAKQFAILSGTPTVDNNIFTIIPWLRQLAPFEVNASNFFVAMGLAVSVHKPGPMVLAEQEITVHVDEEYKKQVPSALGGTLAPSSARLDIQKLIKLCVNKYCTPRMLELIRGSLAEGKKVMVIAQDKTHAKAIETALEEVRPKITLTKDTSLNLTPANVRLQKVPDYKVVIVPQRYSTGFNLSTLSVIVTSIYPGNAAQRSQLLSRVNREGNVHKTLWIYRVMARHLMQRIYESQEKNDSFLKIVKDLQSLK